MAKISCFILTMNDENKIFNTLNSIKNIANEIIIIDSGSTDGTLAIAKSFGANIVMSRCHDKITFGESLCKNDWLLNVNPSEELTIDLQNEIEFIFTSNIQDRYIAYQINFIPKNRTNIFIEYFLRKKMQLIRLYNKKIYSCASSLNFSNYNTALLHNKNLPRNKIYCLNEFAYY